MMPQSTGARFAGIDDAAVVERTGKSWAEWIAVLDRAGAAHMRHLEIEQHLTGRHALSGGWAQMVAVGYEQAKGLREPEERADGFAASVSRSFDVPVEMLFDAWHDDARRRRWYGADDFTITTATRPRSLRLRLASDGGRVAVDFYGRGAMHSRLSVDQKRLPAAEDVPRVKRHWAEALERLRDDLAV
jgi:hypothetical protein